MLLKKKKYKSGEVIVHEKTVGNSAYVIESGRVEVSRKFGDQRIVFSTLEKGSIFGEMCLIDQLPRSATVTAVEDTVVTILGQIQFQNVLRQLSPPVLSIIKVMTERLRLTGSLVSPLKLTNFYYSLCSLIYLLAKAKGKESEKGLSLDFKEVLSDCSTILALEKGQVEKVFNRMVFTRLVQLDKGDGRDNEIENLVISDLEHFGKFLDFLKLEATGESGRGDKEHRPMPDKTYQVLKKLTEESREFQASGGTITLSYERCLQLVEDLFGYPKDETNEIFKPLIEEGIFKLVIDPESGTGQLTCAAPDRLQARLEEQEGFKVFRKMVNLLKTLAG
ncbi:MAG: cyclic nucleotide-binding domain-containing protein [Candidatus Glassbacteria bacterium]|nr:cyclic nucleotide-binding domain-containing protein [Candidatus Glassbacteria bacterium]